MTECTEITIITINTDDNKTIDVLNWGDKKCLFQMGQSDVISMLVNLHNKIA